MESFENVVTRLVSEVIGYTDLGLSKSAALSMVKKNTCAWKEVEARINYCPQCSSHERTIDDHKAPREVRSSPLGCRNCLWASCECSFGSKYQASEKVSYGRKKVATCKAYTFFD